MLKKTLTYKDYNNVERTETHLFNLSEAELTEMEMGTEGGYAEMLQNIIDAKDQVALIRTFKKIILKAYGVKSPDGREFIKSKKISKKFSHTEAFNILYMELVTDTDAAIQFVNGIMPAKLIEKVKAKQEEAKKKEATESPVLPGETEA